MEAWKAATCESTGVCLFGTSTSRKDEVARGVFLEQTGDRVLEIEERQSRLSMEEEGRMRDAMPTSQLGPSLLAGM